MRPQLLNPLFEPVTSLDGIGPKLGKLFANLLGSGPELPIPRVKELLFHLPHALIDRRDQPGIANATEGKVQTFKVQIDKHIPPPRSNRRIPYRVMVHDDTAEMTLVFFHAHGDWLTKTLPEGQQRFVSGRIEMFNGKPNMVHPDHMVPEEEFQTLPLLDTVYGATAGLSSKIIARSAKQAVSLIPQIPEWNDAELVRKNNWPAFKLALQKLHQPTEVEDTLVTGPNRARLAHDELFAGQLALSLLRDRFRKSSGTRRGGTGILSDKLRGVLPYALTDAQERSIAEIAGDLAGEVRMLRLLQGDVGSGKTIVALFAALQVIESGAQVALMAPTEILARQHFNTIGAFCEELGITVGLLTGKDRQSIRKDMQKRLLKGEVKLVIGTHALFQEQVEFQGLGLAIIDEQHRFGVHQRLMLGDKGKSTDILVMTATPIPRTLVLTAYGDMDVSRLDEKPAGRLPIKTTAIASDRIEELIARVGGAIADGKKVYWICPLVEESELVDITSAQDRFSDMQQKLGDKVGLIHGRMKADEKEAAMESFRTGHTRLLVATTVIEVGVDVPDATIMVIEHAERFGLAQLHQLRGRVGRGTENSSCVLLFYGPLSQTAQARLKIMRETEDGFRIAEEDLRLRGEGEILGTRQSGIPGFNLASLEHHSYLLETARKGAALVLETNPDLVGDRGKALRMLLYLFGQDQAIRLLRAG